MACSDQPRAAKVYEPQGATLAEFAGNLFRLISEDRDEHGWPIQVNFVRPGRGCGSGAGWMRFFDRHELSAFLHGLDFAAEWADQPGYHRALGIPE